MSKSKEILGTEEAWEKGELGTEEQFAAVSSLLNEEVDDALDLAPISIRLPKQLIKEFKLIAELNGLGYQPLMRRALQRFAEGEMKLIMRSYLAAQKQREEEELAAKEADSGEEAAVA